MIFDLVCGLINLVFLFFGLLVLFILGYAINDHVSRYHERTRLKEASERYERERAAERLRQQALEAARRDALARNPAERAIATLQRLDDALVGKIHELRVDERALRASIKATLGDSHDF